MTEIYVERRGQHLIPINAHFAEELEALPQGVMFKAKLTRPRSTPHNSFYFVCLGEMVKAGAEGSKEDLHDSTKIKCGLVRAMKTPIGEFIAFPDSTAFHKLDQIAFNAYFDRAISFWKTSKLWDYLPRDIQDKLEEGHR